MCRLSPRGLRSPPLPDLVTLLLPRQAEFSSLYLLSLVRILVQLGAPSVPPHSVAMSKCMLTKPAHPTSARLMRQHTGLALSLYQLVVADLCHSVNSFVPVRDCDVSAFVSIRTAPPLALINLV